MVRIGIAGIGFMGLTHFTAASGLRGGRVRAIVSRSAKKRNGDWRGLGGNFGLGGGRVDLTGIKAYTDVDRLIDDPEIDVVDLCLPSSMHCETAIRALRAGKHVLVEKPIALSLREADRMLRAAERAGRHLMVAHVLPFFPEFVWLKKVVEDRTYGELVGAHFKRIISMPDWSQGVSNFARSGGPGVDLHIHDTHFIELLCGSPDRVSSTGCLVDDRYAVYLSTNYTFNDRPNLAVTCASGAIAMNGRPFAHGFEVYTDRATIVYEGATLAGRPHETIPLTVITNDGKAKRPRLGRGDVTRVFTRELQAAVDVVRSGTPSPELSGQRAAKALRLCFKETESVRRGRPISVRR